MLSRQHKMLTLFFINPVELTSISVTPFYLGAARSISAGGSRTDGPNSHGFHTHTHTALKRSPLLSLKGHGSTAGQRKQNRIRVLKWPGRCPAVDSIEIPRWDCKQAALKGTPLEHQ